MMYNPFPATYNNGYMQNGYQQPMYQQAYPQVQQQPQMPQYQQQMPMQSQTTNGINWVSGEAGARAFYVEPGTSAWLMDSEEMVGYVKTVSPSGVPMPLEIYELTRRINAQPVQSYDQPLQIEQKPDIDLSQYVKKEDVERMISKEVERRMADAQKMRREKQQQNG